MRPYYSDDSVTLYHGDYRAVLPQVGEVDVLLTDIPYNISQESGGLRELSYGAWDGGFDHTAFVDAVIGLVRKSVYIWCHETQVSEILLAFRAAGLIDRALVWVKKNPTVINGDRLWLPGFEICAFGKVRGAEFHEHCHAGVWTASPDRMRLHPCQKPINIIQHQILASSTSGDLVFDPCAGSGTTLRAAKNVGRRAIGIESVEAHCEIIAQRLTQEVLDLGDVA